VPALAVWLASLPRLGRHWRADAAGMLAGGLLAGLPGVAWLVASGAWPYFVEVFRVWNPEYVGAGDMTPIDQAEFALTCLQPWSDLHLAAVPLAVFAVVQACRRRDTDPARGLLAALYLGWLAQAAFVQKPFDYVHVPALLLAMAVLASFRWPVALIALAWFLAVEVFVGLPGADARLDRVRRWDDDLYCLTTTRHGLTNRDRMAAWGQCWSAGTPELRNRTALMRDYPGGADWVALDRVADFLRGQHVGDGELLCWHDSPHPLYLTLDVKPAVRYMHVGTILRFTGRLEQMRAEVVAAQPRFAVSDLNRVGEWSNWWYAPDPSDGRPELPASFPDVLKDVFPFDQPVVFRSGRYVVHRVERPVGKLVP
jgi:hypothetical protein